MMTKRLAFFIFMINIVNVINGNFPLPAITPEYCNATEFYDPICVRCKRCGGKDETQASLQHRGPDGKCNVKCNSIFYKKKKYFPIIKLEENRNDVTNCVYFIRICPFMLQVDLTLTWYMYKWIVPQDLQFHSVFIFNKPLKKFVFEINQTYLNT